MSGIPRRLLPFALLLALGGAAWFTLNRPPPTATWLTVAAPATAVVGGILPVQVKLLQSTALPEGVTPQVVVDLHWSTTWQEDREFLAAASIPFAAPVGTAMIFPIAIPAREDLGFVHAVIYLAPDGRWEHRIRAAETEDIPVLPAGAAPPDLTPRDLRPVDIVDDPGGMPPQSLALRFLIATGWIACAVLWRRRAKASPGRRPLLPYAALLAAAWELSHLETVLSDLARALAQAHRWYEFRGPLQQVLTVAIVVGTAALCFRMWQGTRDAALRRARLGLLLYAGVSIGSLFSLHSVDALLSQPLLTISLLQIIQLTAVAIALTGGDRR